MFKIGYSYRVLFYSAFFLPLSYPEGEVFFLLLVLYILQPTAEPPLPSPWLIFLVLLKAGTKATAKFLEDRTSQ